MKPPLVKRLVIKNYKSIAHCAIALDAVTVFVGQNGAGKSNILDALRFAKDALDTTLEFAMRERGGIQEVRRRSMASRPTTFEVVLDLELNGRGATYQFRVGAAKGMGFEVVRERCQIRGGTLPGEFFVERGEVKKWTWAGKPPASQGDRLFLVAASGASPLREVWEALTRMTFLNLNPEEMKKPQKPEAGALLSRDGHNFASVIKGLDEQREVRARVVRYLETVTGQPIEEISHKLIGAFETARFHQRVEGRTTPWVFDASSMSDGTMRVSGILVSLLSAGGGNAGRVPTLVGIEEPETALHPAAAGRLTDAILEASDSVQVILTCHSPELLDTESLDTKRIRVVMNANGKTVVGPLAPKKLELLAKHLSTPGELLRLEQLTPDLQAIADMEKHPLFVGDDDQ